MENFPARNAEGTLGILITNMCIVYHHCLRLVILMYMLMWFPVCELLKRRYNDCIDGVPVPHNQLHAIGIAV